MTRLLVPRRRPEALLLDARPGDVLLRPGEMPLPLPTVARVLDRYDLLPVAERARIRDAVPRWLAALAATDAARRLERDGISPVDLVAGERVPALLEGLRLGLLLARLREGTRRPEWVVGSPWPALGPALAGAAIPPERVTGRREPRWHLLLPALPRLGGLLGTIGRAPVSSPARPSPPAPGRVLLLEASRTRALGRELEEAGVPLARLVPRDENRYLPVPPSPVALDGEAWDRLLATIPPAPPEMPGGPGFDPRRVLGAVLRDAFSLAARRLGEALAWRELLRELRPPAIVAGLPWQGDLRALAFAARSLDVPFVAVQDGVLGWAGIGAILPPTAAFSWGPEGTRWFVARGFPRDRVFEVGDPLLEPRKHRVFSIDPREARRRLGLPPGRRVLLAGLANSSPHDVHAEEDSPLAALAGIARGIRDADGWVLAVKPHPRLPRVDGLARLAEADRVLRGISARLLPPATDIALALAAADAWISEGDTVTVEAIVAGRDVLAWRGGAAPCPCPDMAGNAVPSAADPGELAGLLSRDRLPPANPALLGGQVRRVASPADALAHLAPDIDSAYGPVCRTTCHQPPSVP